MPLHLSCLSIAAPADRPIPPSQSKGRLEVYHVLNNPPAGWTQGTGFISKDLIESKLSKALENDKSKVLLCGPPPMLTAMTSAIISPARGSRKRTGRES